MAEAAVVEQLPTRFYCHVCNVEINIPNTDFTCPLCSGGFVEELPANAPVGMPSAGHSGPLADRETEQADAQFRVADLRDEIATLLMSRNNGQPIDFVANRNPIGPHIFFGLEGAAGPLDRGAAGPSTSGGSGGGAATTAGGLFGGRAGARAGGRVRPTNLAGLDTVLMEFLQSLTTGGNLPFGPGDHALGGHSGGANSLWMGNLGDYAWGREGIDTIVTQLLNQMETSGPPPLARDKIDAIPKVEVSEEEVSRKSQCSVCWEDFQLNEIVRKLPCSHIYHENCIVPWLDLHGTCPICRKSLCDEDADNGSTDGVGVPSSDRNVPTGGSQVPNIRFLEMNDLNHPFAFNRNDDDMHIHTPPNIVTPNHVVVSPIQESQQQQQQPAQQQPTRNNVFTFDDSNVDLD